jgi:hypothetical protein
MTCQRASSDDTDAFLACLMTQSREESTLRPGGPPRHVRPEPSTKQQCVNADSDGDAASLRSYLSPRYTAPFEAQSRVVSYTRNNATMADRPGEK